jgi:ABC-type multidrug transport system permease subunit
VTDAAAARCVPADAAARATEVTVMEFNLGLTGILIVLACALVFGVAAQVVAGPSRRWMWVLATLAYAAGGVIFSEWVFAWATVDDLQPMIDGLLFDESMLGGIVVGVPVVAAAWLLTRQPGVYPPLHG